MAYEDFITQDGRPIELLTFQSGALAFRYTNVGRDVTHGAYTYTALSYRATEPALSKDSDDGRVTFRLPGTATVLALFNGERSSSVMTVTQERFHDNDPAEAIGVHYKGKIVGVTREDGEGVMSSIPFQAGDFSVPRYNYGSLCSSSLYETPGCSVLRDNFRYQTTITSITNGGVQIGFTGLRDRAAVLDAAVNGALSSAELDTYWLAGYIATDAGEVRPIMEANVGSDPDVVRILHPFRDAVATDACTVYAGCLFDIDICNRKFDNAINFRGWPYVPEVDPTHTELPPGSRTSPGPFVGVPT